MRLMLTTLLSVFLLLPVLAQDAPAAAAPAAPPDDDHLVLGWFLMCYGDSVERFSQQIELAQRNGMNGFVLDTFEWQREPGDETSNHVKTMLNMMKAAELAGPDFKLVPCPEYSIGRMAGDDHNFKDLMRRFIHHPNTLRWRGRPVISGYVGNFDKQVADLRAEGLEFWYVPNLWNPRYANQWSVETVLSFYRDHPEMDGTTPFPTFSTDADLASNSAGMRASLWADKLFIGGVNPHYNSANLRDRDGLRGYEALWQGILRDNPPFVHVVTWNDYTEDSGLMPGRWPWGQEKQYISRDESFLDVTQYFSAWYRSGQRPTVSQDKVYLTYRDRRRDQARGWNPKTEAWEDIRYRQYPFDQIHDDSGDYVYATTMLSAPATLSMTLGDQALVAEAPAGASHHRLPLAPGVPLVRLTRGDAVVGEFHGRKQVIAEETKANSMLDGGKHKLLRTYTGGWAAGDGPRFEAAAGTLLAGAEAVTIDGVQAVRTTATDGSGVKLAVSGLAAGTWNLRLRYRNAAATEARLTLRADGVDFGENDRAGYMLPISLPPTDGEFRTVSVLWSLYDPTSLSVTWEAGRVWGNKLNPAGDDIGTVELASIQCVAVQPIQTPARRSAQVPELVRIEGGRFTMGAEGRDRDEAPPHEVTLSTYYLGKYEVTNEQFEMYMPAHRRFRDGYSWRDREPVIYVGWQDAAGYCNWLSEQAGLEPVYDFHTDEKPRPPVSADLTKNGFRLPTEAQWEYAASGRGEGRTYPWGEDAPAPEHGNFWAARGIKEAQTFRPNRPATDRDGVSVVGDFPAGASRDGVMDLAGNVMEWCSDWFHPYSADAQTDPGEGPVAPTEYRSMRGSSWGYYGFPAHVTDREYNSIKYPGYVYVGLRVALPEAGHAVLQQGQEATTR